MTDAGPPVRDRSRAATTSAGHRLVGVEAGFGGQVLHLDVHHRPGADLEGLVQSRHPVGELLGLEPVDGTHPLDLGVVVDHQPSVGRPPDVELDPVGPAGQGPGEGGQGVLPPGTLPAPVGQDQDGGVGAVPPGPAHYLVNHVAPFSSSFISFRRF